MKKVFGIAISLIVLVVAGLSVFASQQPSEYEVTHSVIINKGQSEVFPLVADLQAWESWSPWYEKDPAMKREFSENTRGVGASMTWDSEEVGKGKQTITDVVDDEAIKMELVFTAPMEGKAYSFFKIKSTEDGQTQVSWRMEGKNDSFVKKLFYGLMDVKGMIKQDFEKGLSNLKARLEQ
ncbi:MAG: SRPBCC family protein [Bdellovibrionales bacterium]|nr:SRPBCC family protein [Bdellovibrionales bacterium]